MSQKPDYYAVLGVERTAKEADIKRAFQRIVMSCHPDRLKNRKDLTDAERAEAETKFKFGTEAQAVLTDPVKRTAYDKYGHAGLESIANGQTPQQSWSEAMGPVRKRTRTQEEVFDFFDRAAERNGSAPKVETPVGDGPELSEEEMRRAAAEARRRNRNSNKPDIGSSAYVPPPVSEPRPAVKETKDAPAEKPAAKPASVFEEVASKVSEAADRLRGASAGDVAIPVETLEKFRDNLQDFIGEIDAAIRQARRSGPRNGYNR